LGYDFEIVYKKGKKNVVADVLSRKDEYVEAFLYAISIIQPDVGHYNCLINSNNQVKHKLSTQGSLLFQR
jgi:hypothetical protein